MAAAGGAAAAAIVARRRREIVEAFRRHGATDSQHAKTLDDLGVKASGVFRRLKRIGIIVEKSGDRYWFDEKAWHSYQESRARIGVLVGSLIFFIVLMLAIVAVMRKG